MPKYLVPIAKTFPGTTLEVDTDAIPEGAMWDFVVLHGLSGVAELNKTSKSAGLSGLTKLSEADRNAAYARSLEISKKNFADLIAGKLKLKKSAAKAETVMSRDLQTEARRLARAKVADIIRAAGLPQNSYTPKQKTEAADKLIADNPAIVEQAKANLAAAKNLTTEAFDITAFAAPDADAVAEAAKKKAAAAEKKAAKPLSAKQAGLPTKRAKKPTADKAPTALETANADLLLALNAERATAARTKPGLGQPVH